MTSCLGSKRTGIFSLTTVQAPPSSSSYMSPSFTFLSRGCFTLLSSFFLSLSPGFVSRNSFLKTASFQDYYGKFHEFTNFHKRKETVEQVKSSIFKLNNSQPTWGSISWDPPSSWCPSQCQCPKKWSLTASPNQNRCRTHPRWIR